MPSWVRVRSIGVRFRLVRFVFNSIRARLGSIHWLGPCARSYSSHRLNPFGALAFGFDSSWVYLASIGHIPIRHTAGQGEDIEPRWIRHWLNQIVRHGLGTCVPSYPPQAIPPLLLLCPSCLLFFFVCVFLCLAWPESYDAACFVP